MKLNRLFIASALLGTVLAACQREQEVQLPEENTTETWTLTLKAAKGLDTRLLVLSNNDTKLNAEWRVDEKVDVFSGDTYLGTLTAQEDGASATLSGDLNNNATDIEVNDVLTLHFPGRGASYYESNEPYDLNYNG